MFFIANLITLVGAYYSSFMQYNKYYRRCPNGFSIKTK